MTLQALLSRVPIVGHLVGNASINVTALAIESIFVILGAVIPLIIYAVQNKKGNDVEDIGTAADKNIIALISSFVGIIVGKFISDLVKSALYFFETPITQAQQDTDNSTNHASSNNVVPTEPITNNIQNSRASRTRSSDSGFHPYQEEYEAYYAAEAEASRKRALSQSDTAYPTPVILSNLRQTSDSTRSDIFPMSVLDLDSLSSDNRPDNGTTRLTIR